LAYPMIEIKIDLRAFLPVRPPASGEPARLEPVNDRARLDRDAAL
jgi:hypothetical protein